MLGTKLKVENEETSDGGGSATSVALEHRMGDSVIDDGKGKYGSDALALDGSQRNARLALPNDLSTGATAFPPPTEGG